MTCFEKELIRIGQRSPEICVKPFWIQGPNSHEGARKNITLVLHHETSYNECYKWEYL